MWRLALAYFPHRSQRGGRGFESPLVHQILNNLTNFSESQKFARFAISDLRRCLLVARQRKAHPRFFCPSQTPFALLQQDAFTKTKISRRMTIQRSKQNPAATPTFSHRANFSTGSLGNRWCGDTPNAIAHRGILLRRWTSWLRGSFRATPSRLSAPRRGGPFRI